MSRCYRLFSAVFAIVATVGAVAQAPFNSAPAPSVPTPRPAHSDDPLSRDGTKANPADATSPPLADPLKQQAVTDAPPTLASPAVEFITRASMEGLAEMQMARVALEQSNTPRVREFAQRMVADHQSLNAKLEALAADKGTSLPAVLDTDHASSVQRLSVRSGKMFDHAYAVEMRSVHDRALALYRAASSLSDLQVARFASDALPMLRAHRSQAQSL